MWGTLSAYASLGAVTIAGLSGFPHDVEAAAAAEAALASAAEIVHSTLPVSRLSNEHGCNENKHQ